MGNYDQMLYGQGYDPFAVSQAEKKAIKKQMGDTFIMCIIAHVMISVIAMFIFDLMDAYPGYEFRTADNGLSIMDWQYSLAGSMPSIIMCTVLFLFDKFTNKIKMDDYLRTDRMGGSFIPLFLCVLAFGYVTSILIQLLVTTGFNAFDYSPMNENYYFETDLTPAYLAQEVLTTIVLAPIAEELMFRGVVLRRLSKVSRRFGIIVSAMFFGLMHGNLLQTILGFIIGVIFAYADIKAGSLLPSIIGHMFVNGSAVAMSFVEYFAGEQASTMAWTIMLIMFFIIGAIFALVLFFGKKIRFPESTEYHRKRTVPIMVTCISFWIIMAFYIVDVITAMGPLTDIMKE